jgi:hypothetical protein
VVGGQYRKRTSARETEPGAPAKTPESALPEKEQKDVDEHTTRKPMVLFGLFLLRLAERALSWLLFQDPPRSTRGSRTGGPHRRSRQQRRFYDPGRAAAKVIVQKIEAALARRLSVISAQKMGTNKPHENRCS